jgi:hypothetical protein
MPVEDTQRVLKVVMIKKALLLTSITTKLMWSPYNESRQATHQEVYRMKKILILLSALVLQSAILLDAQVINDTVNYSGTLGQRPIFDSLGVPVPDGSQVRLGFFSNDASVPGASGDLSALGAMWTTFDSTTTGTPVPGGFFSTTGANDASIFGGHKIYLWAFKTIGNATPAIDYSNVLEYGLYSSTTLWTFPIYSGTGPAPSPLNIDTTQVDQAFHGTFDNISAPPFLTGHLNLEAVTPVPEPNGIALMGGLCLVAVTTFRKLRGKASHSP